MQNSKLLLIFASLLALCFPVFAISDSALCKIQFDSMSRTSGAPGDTFEMYGIWEENQGNKTAGINRGRGNKLEIISWSNSVIKVRIPDGLRQGVYRVGVYCNNPPHWQGSTWKDFEVTGSGSDSSENRPLIDDREKRFERKKPEITQRTETNKPLNEDEQIASDTEKTMKIGIAIIVFIIMVIIFIARKRSVTIVTFPNHEQGSSSNHPKWQIPKPWTGVYNDIEYTVEFLGSGGSGPVITVYINLPALLSQRLEVNARKDRPSISDKRARDINALLDLGVDYIDISFNTNWIAAEVPVSRANVDKNLAKKIAGHLIRLRDFSQ